MDASYDAPPVSLPASPECLDEVSQLIEKIWEAVPDISLDNRLAFETAVLEVAANIVLHSGGRAGDVWSLKLTVTVGQVEAHLEDSGVPASVDLAHPQLPDALAESGRGLALVWALVDELRYSRVSGVNQWHLVRLLKRDIA